MKSQILGMAGDLDQARAVAERYLHESAPEYPSDHCKQHESAGNLAAENGDFRKAIEHYSEMQKHARRDTDNPRDLIQSLYLQGLAFLRLGEFKASFDSLAKGEELARQHPVEDLLDRIFFTRAELQIVSGEPEKALETIERIDLDGRELPDLFRIGALDLLTIALSSVERWDEALKRCREAKECLGSHQNLNLRAQLDYRLASIQLEMQLYSDVVDSVDSSLSTLREPNAVILMQLLKCESLLELGRTDEASQTYQACIEVADSSD
ncbi:unnamed protein product, partial [Hapterophycus canaliculatus]